MGKRFAIVIGVAAAGVMALGAQTAAAAGQQLSCGDTITTDTTLHKDLVDCPTNGIVIGADNVTLDLNGHTIDGDGTIHPAPGGVGQLQDAGVSVFVDCHEMTGLSIQCTSHDGITVKDGSIRQFGTGFDAVWSRHLRLLGLATSANQLGIALSADERVLVRDCSVNRTTGRNGFGLLVGSAGGPGFGGHRVSDHVRIVNSSFRNNAGDGISSGGTTNSVIEGNLLSHNGDTGIAWGGDRNQLSGNRIIGDETGIALSGHRNVIARNRVSGGREGIRIDRGGRNLLAGNVVAGAATSIRIKGERGEHEDRAPGAVHTVIRGNRLLRANDDGVFVELTAKDTLLRHNSARHSQGDGFDVNDRSTKLSRNRAVRNGDLGIEAVRGVNDGGGNVARHNGDPRQCTHIGCR